MSRVSRGTPSGNAYLDLRNRAQRDGRPTQELLQLYILEAFLGRLAASEARSKFVLKGGVLLAAFDSRRPTRDVDLAGLDLANDAEAVLGLVTSIVSAPPDVDDGVEFLPATATAEVIREEDEYSGVRISMDARLGLRRTFHSTSTSMSATRFGRRRARSRCRVSAAVSRSLSRAIRFTWSMPKRS